MKKIKYKGHTYVRADSVLHITDWNVPVRDFAKAKQLIDKAAQEARRKSYNYEHYIEQVIMLLDAYRP